jgi:hypothetical protein
MGGRAISKIREAGFEELRNDHSKETSRVVPGITLPVVFSGS